MGWRRLTDGVAPVTDGVAPVTDGVAPVTDGVAPVSDVIALIQDMLTSVAGAVVPLTQLQSDLYSFLLGIAGVAPVPNLVAAVSDVIALIQDMLTSVAGAVVPLLTQLQSALYSFLLGIAGVQPVVAGLGGRCWAVGSRGCVGGVAMAAGPVTCRYPGRAVGRQRDRGCNAREACGIHFRRDDPGSARWRHSDG